MLRVGVWMMWGVCIEEGWEHSVESGGTSPWCPGIEAGTVEVTLCHAYLWKGYLFLAEGTIRERVEAPEVGPACPCCRTSIRPHVVTFAGQGGGG